MSLLGTPVYANPSTPLWATVGSPTFTGQVLAPEFATTPGGDILVRDVSGNTGMRFVATTPGTNYIQNSGTIRFGQIGQGNTNTSLTVSAPGANADVLTVGGQFIGGGVTPIECVTPGTIQTIALASGSSPRTATFAVQTLAPITSNATYDIQAIGNLSWNAGSAPSPGDRLTVTIACGSGIGSYSQDFYPANDYPNWALNDVIPFYLRSRLIANNPFSNASCSVTYTGATGTGNIGGQLSMLSVVRVATP